MGGELDIIADELHELKARITSVIRQRHHQLQEHINRLMRERTGLASDYEQSLLYERYQEGDYLLGEVIGVLERYATKQRRIDAKSKQQPEEVYGLS